MCMEMITYLVILAHHYILCVKQLLVLFITDIISTVQWLLTNKGKTNVTSVASIYR